MNDTRSRWGLSGAAVFSALLLISTGAAAQDTESVEVVEDVAGLFGECGGAEFAVRSVDAPFGEMLGSQLTSGVVEVDYSLPEGTLNPFISFSVADGSGLSLKGSEILEQNPQAENINPDASYPGTTMAGTLLQAEIGQPASATIELVGGTEQSYLEKWALRGVDLLDFQVPPYSHGDRLDTFLSFELDGARYFWSSQSTSPDCIVAEF